MPICLYKEGLIVLSLILPAVKCHAASRARNVGRNPITTYAKLSNMIPQIYGN
jgi:hypothetical protein